MRDQFATLALRSVVIASMGATFQSGRTQTHPMAQFLTEQQMVETGGRLFQRHCMGCHGTDAKGTGKAAVMLDPKPRNLVEGSFKFRSTPTGSLPTRADLLRTIDQGVPGTSMPSFRELDGPSKMSLVLYVQGLRPAWKESQGVPLRFPEPPAEVFGTKAQLVSAATRGYKTYSEVCMTCHGSTGLGDGESAPGLVDGENRPIHPANFSRPFIKSGRDPRDVYKAIATGLDGTPMPGFDGVYDEKTLWDLVAYVMFRRGQGSGLYAPDLALGAQQKDSVKK